MDKEISQAVIARLPRYFRYLGELKDSGVERISSQELSRLMHVTRSGRISIISEASDNRGMAITWSICIPRSARYSDWIKSII